MPPKISAIVTVYKRTQFLYAFQVETARGGIALS